MDEEYKQALSAALRLVSHHDRTECELRKKLSDRGFQEEVIESVVCRLIDDNFINDRRYTEYYVTFYSSKRSKKRIRMELTGKGISEEVISEYIDECDSNAAVMKAYKKQLARRGLSEEDDIGRTDMEKIAAALYRQGFTADDIRSCFS